MELVEAEAILDATAFVARVSALIGDAPEGNIPTELASEVLTAAEEELARVLDEVSKQRRSRAVEKELRRLGVRVDVPVVAPAAPLAVLASGLASMPGPAVTDTPTGAAPQFVPPPEDSATGYGGRVIPRSSDPYFGRTGGG